MRKKTYLPMRSQIKFMGGLCTRFSRALFQLNAKYELLKLESIKCKFWTASNPRTYLSIQSCRRKNIIEISD